MDGREHESPSFEGLATELETRLREGVDHPWPASGFDDFALRTFRVQFDHNEPYRAFCLGRGATPDTVERWQDVPPVPAMAFKHLDLCSVGGEPEVVFRTSGTTRGAQRRGRHLVPRRSLYRASLVGPFRRHLLAGVERIRFVSLVPPAEAAPDSSLSWMVSAAAEELASRTDWLVDARGDLDVDALRAVARETARAGEPVLLLGTALAFVHALARLEGRPMTPLAPGSRIMETGGLKGLGRAVPREELYAGIRDATGVPTERIVNEYGMTELLSQLYEPVLTEGASGAGRHVAPPWLRVRALDPASLAPLPEGEEGILAFFDLANLGSVAHVLTQDVGAVSDGRLRLRGRLPGAEPRGCSRAMDELLSASST